MPSLPKDHPSGRLGRLLTALRPSRAGPLPVQTGFPTSLADLVVKNHGRLKKQPSPSSKRGKRGGAASLSPSPSPSPSPSTPTSPSPPPASPPPPVPAAAVAVSPSDRARPELPPAQPPRRGKGGGFGLGLGFLAVSGVVSLALLVIWSKKVVAAVTVASFSLYLLESVRSSSLPPRRRPRPVATERRLCLDGRGRVSPIREVDAGTEPSRPSCSDSDRGSDACILPLEVQESGGGGVLDESSNPKAKAKKKSWKKLLTSAKKLHRGRRSKEAGSPGSSFRSEGDRADDATTARGGGGNAKAADSSGSLRGTASQTGVAAEDAAIRVADSSRGSRRSQGVDVDAATAAVEIDASVDDLIEEEEEQEKLAGIRFPALLLVAVVLVGLVAGKLLALALTVLCAAFLSSVRRSPCGGGGGGGGCSQSQGRRLELSMS